MTIKPLCLVGAIFLATGCAHTIKVQAPDKPIKIDLDIHIDQEVRIKLDKDVDDLIKNNPNIF